MPGPRPDPSPRCPGAGSRSARSRRRSASARTRPWLRLRRAEMPSTAQLRLGLDLAVQLVARGVLLVPESCRARPRRHRSPCSCRRNWPRSIHSVPRASRAQERAVVRDQHEAGAGRGKLLLEPANRLDIEMVGRLVQQHQVGLGGQQPRQRRAPPLAARRGGDRHRAGRTPAPRRRARRGTARPAPARGGVVAEGGKARQVRRPAPCSRPITPAGTARVAGIGARRDPPSAASASTCPSRCGRPAPAGRRAGRSVRPRRSSGSPPKVSEMADSCRRGARAMPASYAARPAPSIRQRRGIPLCSGRIWLPATTVRLHAAAQDACVASSPALKPAIYPATPRSSRARPGGTARISSPVKTCSVFRSRSTTAWSETQPPISR